MRMGALRTTVASIICIGASSLLSAITPANASGRFDGWTSVVIAADWRDGSGKPIEVFDNARRDLSRSFLDAGLPGDLHLSLTLNPAKPDATPARDALMQIASNYRRSEKGCLFYITSHGGPDRIIFGDTQGLQPANLASMVRHWCGTKPTVVVLSACYSGAFVDALRAPNRMIMTASRRDRSSFGCGEGETYPWFDACVLESLPKATDFLEMAHLTRGCVSRRETDAKIPLPSEPQLYIGAEMQMRLPTLRFSHSP